MSGRCAALLWAKRRMNTARRPSPVALRPAPRALRRITKGTVPHLSAIQIFDMKARYWPSFMPR